MIRTLPKLIGYTVAMCMILLIFAFAGKVYAKNSEKPSTAPVVTLQIWQASSMQEQYAFLAGFVSMFELEKEWQGQKGILPLQQSMIGSWGMGMNGMSLKSIRNAVNAYCANNPNEVDRLVLDVLWHEFVQPKLEAASAAGANAEQRVRKAMKNKKQ